MLISKSLKIREKRKNVFEVYVPTRLFELGVEFKLGVEFICEKYPFLVPLIKKLLGISFL